MFTTPVRTLARLTAGLAAFATVLAVNSSRNAAGAAPAEPLAQLVLARAAPGEENPRVLPGLVQWHPTFEAARDAAEKSGRPVLVFHMMGQLDRQFC